MHSYPTRLTYILIYPHIHNYPHIHSYPCTRYKSLPPKTKKILRTSLQLCLIVSNLNIFNCTFALYIRKKYLKYPFLNFNIYGDYAKRMKLRQLYNWFVFIFYFAVSESSFSFFFSSLFSFFIFFFIYTVHTRNANVWQGGKLATHCVVIPFLNE